MPDTDQPPRRRQPITPELRAAIIAGRREGKKLREIAADLHLPLGTVGTVVWQHKREAGND
jgi:hypothetical protein